MSLSEPVLLLDTARAKRNLDAMCARARDAGTHLRPHFKTHQSHVVGRWFRDAGVSAIAVSSPAMAEYFAADGWDDITLAFPFHPGMRDRIDALAARLRIGITVADADALAGVAFGAPVDVWLKIDVGSHRTGFDPDDLHTLQRVASAVAGRSDTRLRGLLAHAGHTYGARGSGAIARIHEQALARLRTLRERLAAGVGPLELSVGDTPACSTQSDWAGVDEMRPGNFIYYDLVQWQVGSCGVQDIAVAMACPVVARHPARGELVVHGGAVHFSRDSMAIDGRRVFGMAAEADGRGWGAPLPEVVIDRLSQEHGIVRAPEAFIRAHPPGSTLYLLPVHSCLTADAMGAVRTLDGETLAMMPRGPSAPA